MEVEEKSLIDLIRAADHLADVLDEIKTMIDRESIRRADRMNQGIKTVGEYLSTQDMAAVSSEEKWKIFQMLFEQTQDDFEERRPFIDTLFVASEELRKHVDAIRKVPQQ